MDLLSLIKKSGGAVNKMHITFNIIKEEHPNIDDHKAEKLALVWDAVSQKIINKSLEIFYDKTQPIHIDLKGELVYEIASLTDFISKSVVEKRTLNRNIDTIEKDAEHSHCFSKEGEANISETAKIIFEVVLLKKYIDDWEPRTNKLLKKKKRITKISEKPVNNNHYISSFIIKEYWSCDQKIYKNKIIPSTGSIYKNGISSGSWGYKKNLYSDYLEAYFCLIEGDAKEPVEKILRYIPLNEHEKRSLICFFIIQKIRNPKFIDKYKEGISKRIVGSTEESLDNSYESLFKNNELYSELSKCFVENKWLILRSSKHDFVLPDSFCVYGTWNNLKYFIAPMSPTHCFILLPEKDRTEKKIINHLKDIEVDNVKKLLIKSSIESFLSHYDFKADKPTEFKEVELIDQLFSVISLEIKNNESKYNRYYPIK